MSDGPRVSLRTVQPGDIRALAKADAECFDDAWPESYFATELFAPGRFHRVLVEPAGEIVAYLFTAWHFLNLHIVNVATLPDYRRFGLGRRLMLIAEEYARQRAGESLTLEVRTGNTPALRLYEGLGYEQVGVLAGYYADGTDALIMAKRVGMDQ